MKSDIDRLMAERGFDAFLIMGDAKENHPLHYMTNHAKVTQGFVVKKRAEAPVLIVGGMERDEAAKSGLEVKIMSDFHYYQHIKDTRSVFEGQVQMLAEIFEHYGIAGTVGVYGTGDPGRSYEMLKRLDGAIPTITIAGEAETTLFDEAYATKDTDELAAMKDVAEQTNTVMAEVMGFVQGHRVENDGLVGGDGQPLTVGAVKSYLQARLLERGLTDDGETIFAVNRDAGVPHSRGEDADELRLGDCIIFDLFPRSLTSGYYHDMTRTFCLGHASEQVQRVYDAVMQAFNAVKDQMEVGKDTGYYQALACDILEEHGHKTPRTDPGTQEGYVHSLGHGLGLEIHGRPRLSSVSDDVLTPGQVFTIEPGLYYPDRGFGVRIEDTIYVDENGEFHSLTTYSKDLVIAFD